MSDVKSVLDSINKQYKEQVGTIGILHPEIPRIPTGIFQLDLASGGGFPIGRTSIVYGPESSLKTTIALLALANAQKLWPDKTPVYVDVEHALDKVWVEKLGVDTSRMAYISPDTSEQVIDIVEEFMYAKDVSVIVVDSLAAMASKKELEESAEKDMVGRSGLLINRFYRKTSVAHGVAQKKGLSPTLILINQIRMKIGVLYGNPETMPGGPSFKFASSMTLRVYGKDEFEKSLGDKLPAYKKVTFKIAKWKVPIVAQTGEYLMATRAIETYNLLPGQSYDWNTVVKYLKDYGLLIQGGGTWDLTNPDDGTVLQSFKTQAELQQRMQEDRVYGGKIKDMIVQAVLLKGDILDGG